MPDEYEPTIEKLQNFISVEQICNILNSNSSDIANKMILDCAIEQISCGEELLDLCDQLDTISTSNNLKIVINEIRFGKHYYYLYYIYCIIYYQVGIHQSIQSPVSLGATCNTQSLLSTNQLNHPLSSSEQMCDS